MILAVDVDYEEDRAWVAGVLFHHWGDAKPVDEHIIQCAVANEYRPGEFFRRELPCIERLLREIDHPLDCIIVDGYVYLGSDRRPGLGKYLFDAMKQQVPVIGVAKTPYHDTPDTMATFRRGTSRPLYVSAAGMPDEVARQRIRTMHGNHRIPTVLQRVDRLCRQGKA
jgi:deoxyribonuclease V